MRKKLFIQKDLSSFPGTWYEMLYNLTLESRPRSIQSIRGKDFIKKDLSHSELLAEEIKKKTKTLYR